MNKPNRLATCDKVKIIDRKSSYFGKTGILKEPRQVPVGLKLKYHWLVKLDGTETTELFSRDQIERLPDKTVN